MRLQSDVKATLYYGCLFSAGETHMKSDQLPDSVAWDTNTNQSGSCWDSGAVPAPAAVIAEKWKSCAICLEELEDSELLCHTGCGGTFCQTCLEVSFYLGSKWGREFYLDSSRCYRIT